MTNNNEVIIIAEDANGETTVVEIIATDDALLSDKDGDGETLIEEVIEAVFDHVDDSDSTDVAQDNQDITDAEVISAPDAYVTSELISEEVSTDELAGNDLAFDASADFTTTTDFDATSLDSGFASDPMAYSSVDSGSSFSSFDSVDTTSEESAESAESEVDTEAQANFDLATEAQAKADEAIEAGDYEAASQYREDAENAAWEAGDSSMLHGSDASDLTMADYYQDKAADLEEQQSAYAQAGDYEAARDASRDAATYTQWGDIEGGGADHAAEAQQEYANMDMATWQQDIADGYQQDAEAYAAQGDFDNAAMYQAEAGEHQDTADYYGDLGEHNGAYDQYSDVPDASYGGYDYSTDASYASDYSSTTDYSSSYDYSSYDSE
ncbi:MAG: hypothetical protein AB1757_12800 [Acidobacteriota bacterium]